MNYFVTGATGFIGRHLVELLLEREGTIYVLVREGSRGRLEELRNRWGADDDRVVAVVGDLAEPRLGVSEAEISGLKGKIDHFFHLAAIYDMTADAQSQQVANIEGTRHAVELAEAIEAGCFHMVSSIAAAGLYKGTWREDMFEEAENLDTHPYFRTKHESERVVREECSRPWRVYRPGIVVGDSETGEMDKIDGPYYFFKLIQRLRNTLPQWMPTVGVEGKEINLVPVDFVAKALDHIAHEPGLDGKAFSLTDPNPKSAGQVINLFSRSANAPQMSMRLDPKMFEVDPPGGPRRSDDAAAGEADPQPGPRRPRDPRVGPHLRQLPDPLRLHQHPRGARGQRHLGAAAGDLRRQALGLLGAQPRPRPVQGPLALGGDRGQGGADHRRLLGDRQGGRDQVRRGRGDGAAGRPHS